MKVISPFPLSQNIVNLKSEIGVRKKCFSTVRLYLGNTDQGKVNLGWRGKACAIPAAEGPWALQESAPWSCAPLSPATLPGTKSYRSRWLGYGCAELLKAKSGGGKKHRLCTSKRSIKHLCGAGRDEAQLDVLRLSGFGPSSANYVDRRDPEVWPPFSQLVKHMSHPNEDKLVYLCRGMGPGKG